MNKKEIKGYMLKQFLDAASQLSLWKSYTPTHIETLQDTKQLDDNEPIKAVDSHMTKYLNGKAPDISTHSKDYSLTPHIVEVLGASWFMLYAELSRTGFTVC
ncbi:10384_t:CDS:2 [Paraglomus occultum]|uniref:10384_t:CDS:1 n=1 Tax=Paraglomus occultum TaxID=144539 RepID=A0A9N9BVY3_9GLOM|nr:10384_t:CDS:2 [Paraglomus occultum]